MQGLVVPFLGAGISYGARLPGERNLPSQEVTFSPQTDFLVGLLADKLRSNGKHEAMSWRAIRSHLGIPSGNIRPSRKSIVSSKRLAQLAELVDWLFGHGEACAMLPMERFVELEPCPAHRYLAYLAREGLITEMITTNYDTLLEKAFRESFGGQNDITGIGHQESEPSVICTLQAYREKGGLKVHVGHPRQPRLRIYKINGCADKYCKCKDNHNNTERIDEVSPANHDPASEIILTERQLQHFGDRQWARDLLRDRARTNTFVFNGFGSDEPQIRHTVLALMEEFQRDVGPKIKSKQGSLEVARMPNAPVVTAYDAELSFSQCQILYSFYEAHIDPEENLTSKKEMVWKAPEYSAFTGKDRKLFAEGGDENNNTLGADLLWKRVYQAVFGRMLIYYSAPGSHFHRWLEQYGIAPGEQRGRLIEWLYPSERLSGNGLLSTFGRSGELLEPEGDQSKMLLLWKWLRSMMFPSEPCHKEDWYLPLHLDSLFIISTLLLLRLLLFPRRDSEADRNAWCLPRERIREIRGLGLRIRLPGPQNESKQCLYLVHESAPIPGRLVEEDQDDASGAHKMAPGDPRHSRLVIQIAVPSISYQESEGRWQVVIGQIQSAFVDKKISVLWIGRCIRVAAGDFIIEVQRRNNVIKALSLLRTRAAPCRGPHLEPVEAKQKQVPWE